MDLVDYINFVSCSRRSEIYFLKDRPDVVDTVVGSSVHHDHVKDGTVQDALTCGTFIAGIAVYRIFTVDCFGKNFSTCGFSCSS